MTLRPLLLVFLLLLASSRHAAGEDVPSENWPSWRGPLSSGVAPHADPPTEWSEEKNVRWKTAIPGLGHSTPAVWGDRIFLTAAVPVGEALKEPRYSGRPGEHNNLPTTHTHEFVVLCVDRSHGEILWKKTVATALPHEGGHETGSLASASPVADGEFVYAFFGSRGLFALTHEGELVWEKEFPNMFSHHGHGEGSSPALHGNTLVVNWDHEEDSFIAAFNRRTGEKLWRRDRDEGTSWSTPIIIGASHGAPVPQVVVAATKRIRSYALTTGDILWECGGLSANVVASPVAGDGILIAGSSYDTRHMVAVDLASAKGDITGTDSVLWTKSSRTPYVPSPLFYGGCVYYLTHYQGVLSRTEARTGESLGGPIRLGDMREIYASPVAAAGRVYITDRNGVTLVLRDAAQSEPAVEDDDLFLARNVLDDSFSASAALVGGEIFLRGAKFLYCISDGAKPEKP